MNKLSYDLMQMCRHNRDNRDGSHTTQYQRSRALRAMSRDLQALRHLRASSLKPKHVKPRLVNGAIRARAKVR